MLVFLLFLRFGIVFGSICQHGIRYSLGAFLSSLVGCQETFGSGIAYKVKLDEHRRHTCGPQDKEPGLADGLVGSSGVTYKFGLDDRRKLNTFLHMPVL